MTKIKILRTIITKSPACAAEAAQAITAINKKSPAVDSRCGRVAMNALADTSAGWTADERAAIAELMPESADESREYTLRVRLTSSEQIALESNAKSEGVSLSEYARKKIFAS